MKWSSGSASICEALLHESGRLGRRAALRHALSCATAPAGRRCWRPPTPRSGATAPPTAAPEVAPGAVDRRQVPPQRGREHAVPVHDQRVAQGGAERVAVPQRADVPRTEVGDRLVALHRDRRAHQREQVARQRSVGRHRAPLQHVAGDDGRDRSLGAVVGAARVAEPRRAGRQAREGGVALGVDRAVGPHQRGQRELVEDDHHDGTRRDRHRDRPEPGRVALRRHERADGAHEQEPHEEEHVGDGQVLQEQPSGPGAHDQDGAGPHRGSAATDGRPAVVEAEAAHEHVPEHRAQGRDEDQEHVRAQPWVGEPGQAVHEHEDDGRDQGHDGAEPDDLAARVAPGHEELGVATHQVEQRLGDGQAGEADEHQRAAPGGRSGPVRTTLAAVHRPESAGVLEMMSRQPIREPRVPGR